MAPDSLLGRKYDRQEPLRETEGPLTLRGSWRGKLSPRHPLMAAQVVEEDAIFIALFLLVMGVHIAPWEWRKGAQLASLGEVRPPTQGASAQGWLGPLAGRQTGRQKPPHHRPPCSCPGHWPCGRPVLEGPEAHPEPSVSSTRADPHGTAQWSSPARRTYGGRHRKGSGQEGPLAVKSCVLTQG